MKIDMYKTYTREEALRAALIKFNQKGGEK